MAFETSKNFNIKSQTCALFAECQESSSNTLQDAHRFEQAKRQSERFLGFDDDYEQGYRLTNAENTLKTTLFWVFLLFLIFVIIVVLAWHYGLVVWSDK